MTLNNFEDEKEIFVKLVDALEEQQVNFIEEQIKSYVEWNFYALFISFAILA